DIHARRRSPGETERGAVARAAHERRVRDEVLRVEVRVGGFQGETPNQILPPADLDAARPRAADGQVLPLHEVEDDEIPEVVPEERHLGAAAADVALRAELPRGLALGPQIRISDEGIVELADSRSAEGSAAGGSQLPPRIRRQPGDRAAGAPRVAED